MKQIKLWEALPNRKYRVTNIDILFRKYHNLANLIIRENSVISLLYRSERFAFFAIDDDMIILSEREAKKINVKTI